MLTRIYGVAFNTKKELNKHLHALKEAKKRDHKKLGEKLELFFLSSVAPGMPFWMPKGMIIRNILFERWKKIQNKYGYKEVMAPNLIAVDIFKQSGHWEHYKDEMFFTQGKGKKKYALKPMDCPGEIMIYKHKMRSYKDFPIKYSEIGTVMRNEKSGELNGLFRVAQMTQDDAHIFMKEDQIKKQIKEVIEITKEIYKPFDLEYKIYLATRPDDFMGSIKTWNKAEKILKQVMKESKLPVLIKEKDGAFYGPKIDYQAKDSLGRTWQCATIQLDFFMPEKFNLEYIGKDGKKHRPIMCHRAIMGSVERFIGILIEHYGGAFPLWLAPEQVWVIPVGKQHIEYAKKIAKNLAENNFRYQLKDENESVSKKIRNGEIQKIPYLLVVGDEEVKSKSVRARSKGKDLGKIKLTKFIEKTKIEIEKEK
jgi:threonyl-tRNA synthetase